MRFHWVLPDRAFAAQHYGNLDWKPDKHLFAYTRRDAAADACIKAVQTNLNGHEVFYIVAPDTASDTDSNTLAARHFPNVPLKGDPQGHWSFMTSAKANRLLNWYHRIDPASPFILA
jgi:UDP-glucose 4-epimerase